MDAIHPFDLSDEEHTAWERERIARKDAEKARFAEEAERLRGMWE